MEIKYFSMFSGIGGFELGIQRALPNATCIGYSEIDKYAIKTYEKNFKGVTNYGDAAKIKPERLPGFDLLCGGFPCQAFSIAGKRRGFKDTRGTLFFEIARILKVKRPKLVLLENVKGLLNHEKGKTFSTIIQTLEELGYRTQWMVLNSKFFGVPQNRERVFIIGSLRGTSRPKILPFRKNATEVPEILRKEIISPTITTENAHGYGNTVTCGQTHAIYKVQSIQMVNKHRGKKPYDSGNRELTFKTSPISYTVKNTAHECMVLAMRGRNLNNLSDRTSGNLVEQTFEENAKGTTNSLTSIQKDNYVYCMNLQTRSADRPSLKKNPKAGGSGTIGKLDETYCLDSACSQGIALTKQSLLRRLTPIECERLQGYPDNWTEGVSDTQRYKQLGNSVTVNVIESIIKELIKNE